MGLALLAACADPAQRIDDLAARHGLQRQEVRGAGFTHVLYRNTGVGHGGPLHVYLEGDGTPWLREVLPAADPTPRQPLALRLMLQDRGPALYLARPCYHGHAADPGCSPLLWTERRYAPEVVASMVAALQHALTRERHDGLVFVGYSGGAVLALLLAERFPQTRGVLTVAGNLDIARWAALHGYSPLHASLNPADRPALPPGIVQLHYAGGRDRNAPAAVSLPVVSRQRNARFIQMETFDHACCWQDIWPGILEQLRTALAAGRAAGPDAMP
ncbi:MAG TPA: alpha/beta hydrolase [Candidatus Competibacteraceae bacterium]|nr:alpha/beta hydrolase [Candidatus Competibacteraceae bacterium]